MTSPEAFFCQICEVFKNTYFVEHLRTDAYVVVHTVKFTSYLNVNSLMTSSVKTLNTVINK